MFPDDDFQKCLKKVLDILICVSRYASLLDPNSKLNSCLKNAILPQYFTSLNINNFRDPKARNIQNNYPKWFGYQQYSGKYALNIQTNQQQYSGQANYQKPSVQQQANSQPKH